MRPHTRTQFLSLTWLFALNGVTDKSSRFVLQPLLTIRFDCNAKRKKSRKERENVRLNTVTKFNPRFANSSLRSSNNAHPVTVSLSDSR